MKTINIQSPFFAAGKWFGWEGTGIGIDLKELQGEGILVISMQGKDYKIDRLLARQKIEEFNSTWQGKHTPKLGIIPTVEFIPMVQV